MSFIFKKEFHFMIGLGLHGNYQSPGPGGNHKVECPLYDTVPFQYYLQAFWAAGQS